MAPTPQDDAGACPKCRGTGKVLLLVSWADCPTCDGTGVVDEDSVPTGEYPIVRDVQGSGEESGGTPRLDDADDPSYFDDGLEFDDDDMSGDDEWGADDS